MQMLLDKLTRSLEPLNKIPKELGAEYSSLGPELVSHVNHCLEDHPQCHELIGYQPLQVMKTNHDNHLRYIHIVLHFGLYESLLTTLPWVLHSYSTRGFLPDYFLCELQAWRTGLRKLLSPKEAAGIDLLYKWMIDHLDDLYDLGELYVEHMTETVENVPTNEVQQEFYRGLVKGDIGLVMKLANDNISSPEMLKEFYMKVIEPSLYQVGESWARGEISVAQEHMASALVSRVMASTLYSKFALRMPEHGKLIVTSAAQEHHEIGARMVADFLTIDGWNVSYLGANMPGDELVHLMEQQQCRVLALSATMIYHLLHLEDMIQTIRRKPSLNDVKIMVGGQAFQGLSDTFWQSLGADGFAQSAEGASDIAGTWQRT